MPGHGPLPRRPAPLGEPGAELLDGEGGELGKRLPGEAHGERLGAEAGAAAGRAGGVGAVAGEEDADVDLVGALSQPGEEALQVDELPLAAPHPGAGLLGKLAPGEVERDLPALGG